jgi:hypothetical protein
LRLTVPAKNSYQLSAISHQLCSWRSELHAPFEAKLKAES